MMHEEAIKTQNGDATAASKPEAQLSLCLLITDMDATTGGLQKMSRHLLREMNRRGVKTYVCARNYHNLPRREVQEGTIIHRSPVLRRSLLVFNSVVYLADALLFLVRHRKQFDVMHCQQPFGAATVGLLAKKLLGKPLLVRVTLTGESGDVQSIRRMPLASLRLRLLREVDCWVALTTEMESDVRSLGVPPERIRIIPNSSALPAESAFEPEARERARKRLGLEYPQIVVFTGRLSKQKGLDTLLRAWKLLRERHRQAHLLLLGQGGKFEGVFPGVEDELRALCKELELEETVHFLGHIPNVGEYLLASDLFVLPTRAEGMSNALVEAMAAGAAIVTTDIAANRNVVDDEVNALLVPMDDVEKLAAAISRLLDAPQLAAALGRAAREKAGREFSVEGMASRYLDLYSSLIAAQ